LQILFIIFLAIKLNKHLFKGHFQLLINLMNYILLTYLHELL